MLVERPWLRFGIAALTILLAATAWAAPSLTTIQDVLYKADGTRFNGYAFIEWKSFEAADSSSIATNSVTVNIIDGNLRVRLVPTTDASSGAYYSVRFNSDGRIQFEETWAVPPSLVALRLPDVRISGAVAGSSEIVQPPVLTEIQESDVVGLLTDLAIRPVKGPGFAPSRAVFSNSVGALEAVLGNLTDCVRVDGTAGPCGSTEGAGPAFVDAETPAGLINGSNTTFTLSDPPTPASSVGLYRNGILLQQGLDYTIDGNTITFLGVSVPQNGDILLASYRLADSGNPPGAAGGALTGTYPNPDIAEGVISNINIADVAGIAETKLALSYPTHSSANDPTADQKAALSGTAGTASATNPYVTTQDARLSDARQAIGHALLGETHSDSTPGTVTRGDLVVAQGTSPTTFKRLPIGQPNRCLMSNGFDAVWNTCLFTGFSGGSVPFVDASGNLEQNNGKLFWNNSDLRLSVGNSLGLTTLYVYDSKPSTGQTGLTVRAGQGQGSLPLQTWVSSNATELARLDSAGNFSAASFQGHTSNTLAAWRDIGNATDPTLRIDGDGWFNTTLQARKSFEAGQAHTQPQVLCSSEGASSNSTGLTALGSCTIPAGFLKAGDRVDIRFDFSHEGTGSGFSFEARWGATSLVSRTGSAAESMISGRSEAGVHTSGVQFSAQSWGTTLAFSAGLGEAVDSLSSPLQIFFLGRMAISTSDTLTLRNFTVVRYPAQSNP